MKYMPYSHRTYATALTSTVNNVDFSQVYETSLSTIKTSVDGSQFVLKWNTINTPTFITDNSVILTWSGSHADCLTLLSSDEWTPEV